MITRHTITASRRNFFPLPLIILWFTAFGLAPFLTAIDAVHAREAGEVKTVLVMGTGGIQKENTAVARELAINDGLVSAVSLAVTGLMPIETIHDNFPRLNEAIYGQINEFVLGYRVLSETKFKNNYRVLVEADIALHRIKAYLSKLGLSAGKIDLPKILFLMAERDISAGKTVFWWQAGIPFTKTTAEQAMAEKMQKQGFTVVTPDIFPSSLNSPELNTPEPSNQAAQALAEYFHADVFILGSAYAEPAGNSMGNDIQTYRGTISARAIWVKTGEEIAVTLKNNVGVGPDPTIGERESILRAGESAAEDLGLQIIAALKTQQKESNFVTVVVTGAQLLTHLVKLRKALTEISDVQTIQVSEMKAGEAVLKVSYSKEPRQLAQSLLLKPFEGFGINIAEISDDRITIELVPAGRTSANAQQLQPAE
ncbi:MAG: hypothetical protein ACOZF0_04935 [Thermodesulfobacteriota bacterium]